jgi:alkylation response protein AidB-like acyl-CoA dehydrogenase
MELHDDLRKNVREVCRRFPDPYWRQLDARRAYPTEFVQVLTEAGHLVALIPEEYGGSVLGITEAAIILEEINRSGSNSAACHAQMYTMGTVLRHGSEQQKKKYLPQIASGTLRLQAFGVSEPTTGSDTTQLKTTAVRKGETYIVNGQKVWISRAEHSDLMLLIARTTPIEQIKKGSEGLSVFLVDLRTAVGYGLTIKPIRTMMNHATTELFFDDLEKPAENLVGEEGAGFRYLLDGLNAERILIAAECIGDARGLSTVRGVTQASGSSLDGLSAKIREFNFRSPARALTLKPRISCESRRPLSLTQENPAARKRTWQNFWRRMLHGKLPTLPFRRMAASASPKNMTSSASSGRPSSTRLRPFPRI